MAITLDDLYAEIEEYDDEVSNWEENKQAAEEEDEEFDDPYPDKSDRIEDITTLLTEISQDQGKMWPPQGTLFDDEEIKDYIIESVRQSIDYEWDEFPLTCIDWDEVVDHAKTDYSTATFEGYDYYFVE